MKTIFTISTVLILFLSSSIKAQPQTSKKLQVQITNISSDEGFIRVGLYNIKEQFLRKTYKSKAVKAAKNQVSVIFEDLPEGEYAISLYHDKDNNDKLNTNFLRIPTEPYAASNNARSMFGPPKWENAKFELKEDKKAITIKL